MNYELRIMNYELRMGKDPHTPRSNYELRIMNCEFGKGDVSLDPSEEF